MAASNVRIKVTIPDSGVRQLTVKGGAVHDGAERIGQELRDLAVQEVTMMGLIDSGDLRRSLSWEVRSRSGRGVVVRVGSDLAKTKGSVDYPMIIHRGRGVVVPRRARVLKWTGKDGSIVIARRSKAVPAKPYLTNALRRLRIRR